MSKRWGIIFVVALMMAFNLTVYAETEQTPVTGLEMAMDTLELVEGTKDFVNSNVLPKNATNKKVKYLSSNETIASVSPRTGRVKAVAPGECYIKAITDDGGYEAKCRVVVNAIIPVTDIITGVENLTLTERTKGSIYAKVVPQNATNQKVRYTSSDTTIAEVGSVTGIVKAKKEGQCFITAQSLEGVFKKTIAITVKPWVPVESVSLQKKLNSMIVGDQAFVYAVASPGNATDTRIRYMSSDKDVARVSSVSGLIKAVSAGECTIKAYSIDGKMEDCCRVIVEDPYVKVTKVTILNIPEMIHVGDKAGLDACVLPENATRKEIRWESSNEDVIKISENGTIEALTVGTAIIHAISTDGIEGSETIEVLPIAVQNLLLEKEEMEIVRGSVFSIGYQIVPDNATNKSVTVKSENTDIVSVLPQDADGGTYFLARSLGTASVIYKTEDGEKEATCKVHVVSKKTIPIEDIILLTSQYEIEEGGNTAIQYQVVPKDSTEPICIRSLNPDIASASSDSGIVRGLKAGQATIVIESRSKTVKQECQVTVKSRSVVQSLTLSEVEIHLAETERAQLLATMLPENSTQHVTFESSDNSIAIVGTRNGIIKAASTGECTITASVKGGPTAQCKVIVTPEVPIKTIVLARETLSVPVGNKNVINTKVLPNNATNKKLYFESSNEDVISINKGTGFFKAKKPGVCVITVTTSDKKVTVQCIVTVE